MAKMNSNWDINEYINNNDDELYISSLIQGYTHIYKENNQNKKKASRICETSNENLVKTSNLKEIETDRLKEFREKTICDDCWAKLNKKY